MTLAAPTLEYVADLTVFVTAPIEARQVTGLNSRAAGASFRSAAER